MVFIVFCEIVCGVCLNVSDYYLAYRHENCNEKTGAEEKKYSSVYFFDFEEKKRGNQKDEVDSHQTKKPDFRGVIKLLLRNADQLNEEVSAGRQYEVECNYVPIHDNILPLD